MAEHIAKVLLKRAHSPDTAATLFTENVLQRPLVLHPTVPVTKKVRGGRIAKRTGNKKRKPQPLSRGQIRKLGLHEIPKSKQKFGIYKPLNGLWEGYIREVLGIATGRTYIDTLSAGPLLLTADYHGALITVVKSTCPSRVGIRGIVVKDTMFTFEVVTKKDQLKVLPKEGSIFRVIIGECVVELNGDAFKCRAPDRAGRKFKGVFPR
ncbi:RNase P/MRP, p29 subunit [Piedraia hortae CBS 480.64]|uniref:Ribonuclease P protein subunit n=1 Tax=Piedraia hortae CBS 480.64 TaxID=1314780 RepID=A0A6A7C131_9PEZI|nr:RNase P/MRP, p29 subunit [Piedraia hortae CBS 480.64]